MKSQNQTTIPLLVSLMVAAMALCHDANAAQVPIVPSPSLDDLVDDPLDPADDPDAFLVSASGRFRFDNFTFNVVPTGDTVPTAEDIFVTLTETTETVMLLFQIVGRNLAAGPDAFEIQVGYDAHTLDPLDIFTGHTQFMNGRGFGDGSVIINEAIIGDGNTTVAELATFSNLPNQGSRITDSASFGPAQTSVSVDKDIALNGGTEAGGGVAFLSHFKETFDVERIPEPTSVVMLVLGIAGLAAIVRTSRKV